METAEKVSCLSAFRTAFTNALAPTEDDAPTPDYIMATAASTFMADESDPLWGWLIGPPGSFKTEALRSLDEHSGSFFLSSLTPNSIISGYERSDGCDPSLLPQFNDKLVVIKEFTSILQMPDMQVCQVFGHLRSCYDGSHSRGTGTKGLSKYKSKFGLLAAVTPRIDKYTLVHTDLGERFVAFRIYRRGMSDRTERKRIARHVLSAVASKKRWRSHMRGIMHEALDHFMASRPKPPSFTDDQNEVLVDLSDLVSLLRTAPSEGHPVEPEVASRTVQQFRKVAAGHAVADDRRSVDDSDMQLVRRVAADTLPHGISSTLRSLYRHYRIDQHHRVAFGLVSKETGIDVAWLSQLIKQYVYSGLAESYGQEISLSEYAYARLFDSQLLA